VRAGKTLHPTHAARQGSRREAGHTRYGLQQGCIFAGPTSLTDYFLQFPDALLNVLQVGEQVIHFQLIDGG
jgi:hypothetical protein